MKEFWKSVKIWRSYCYKFGVFAFWGHGVLPVMRMTSRFHITDWMVQNQAWRYVSSISPDGGTGNKVCSPCLQIVIYFLKIFLLLSIIHLSTNVYFTDLNVANKLRMLTKIDNNPRCERTFNGSIVSVPEREMSEGNNYIHGKCPTRGQNPNPLRPLIAIRNVHSDNVPIC